MTPQERWSKFESENPERSNYATGFYHVMVRMWRYRHDVDDVSVYLPDETATKLDTYLRDAEPYSYLMDALGVSDAGLRDGDGADLSLFADLMAMAEEGYSPQEALGIVLLRLDEHQRGHDVCQTKN